MVVKAKPGVERHPGSVGTGQPDAGRVVKTSPRFGKLSAAQVRRAVDTVSREAVAGAGSGEASAKG
jgi:hypothetical protein